MTQKEFKAERLVFSFNAKDIEEAKNKISEKIFYNSTIHLSMFELNKGYKYFHLYNYKKEKINYILCVKENCEKYQLRAL